MNLAWKHLWGLYQASVKASMEVMKYMKASTGVNSSEPSTEASLEVVEDLGQKWSLPWKLLSWEKVRVRGRVTLPPWKLPWKMFARKFLPRKLP